MRHGWFVIPGLQTGDRTLEEQRLGVEQALHECKGKTVLDLGCAEGLLAREFAMQGALSVVAIDAVPEHLEVAQQICQRFRNIEFMQIDLHEPPEFAHTFDIVLALGIAHKLHQPEILIRYTTRMSHDLVLVRMTRYAPEILTSKFAQDNKCNVNEEMQAGGFALESVKRGPRDETVHYYRKRRDSHLPR